MLEKSHMLMKSLVAVKYTSGSGVDVAATDMERDDDTLVEGSADGPGVGSTAPISTRTCGPVLEGFAAAPLPAVKDSVSV